jgi:hypothetical protein
MLFKRFQRGLPAILYLVNAFRQYRYHVRKPELLQPLIPAYIFVVLSAGASRPSVAKLLTALLR